MRLKIYFKKSKRKKIILLNVIFFFSLIYSIHSIYSKNAKIFAQSSQFINNSDNNEAQKPIIPLKIKYISNTLAKYLIQFPTDQIQDIEDASELKSARNKYLSLTSKDIKDLDKDQKIAHSFDVLHASLAIKYYLDYVSASGFSNLKANTQLSAKDYKSLILSVSRDIYKHSTIILKAKAADNPSVIHYYRFSNGSLSQNALARLKLTLKDKKASAALKQRVYFALMNFSLLDPAILGSLSKINKIENSYYPRSKSLSLLANVISSLSLASAYGGISKSAVFRDSVDEKYLDFLKLASQKATSLDIKFKNLILNQILYIWFQANRSLAKSPNYLAMPFSLSLYADTEYYHGLEERQALALYQKSQQSNKWKMVYRKFLSKDKFTNYYHLILSKLIQEIYKKYQKTANFNELEQEILWQLRFLKTKNITPGTIVAKDEAGNLSDQAQNLQGLSDDNFNDSNSDSFNLQLKAHADLLVNIYLEIVNRQKSIAYAKNSSKKQKSSYLSLVNRFNTHANPELNLKISLIESQANVLRMLKAYKEAVNHYFKAFKLAKLSNQKLKQLDKAIDTQRILVPWPKSPPINFSKLSIKSVTDARSLLLFYQYKSQILESLQKQLPINNQLWDSIAHQALLNISLKNEIKAADVIFSTMKKSPDHQIIARLSAISLGIYQKYKTWQKLEDLAIFIIDNGMISVTSKNIPYNVHESLQIALAMGGKSLYLKKDFKQAIEKFTHFIKRYPKSLRIFNVRYDLARSYWANEEFVKALNEIQIVVIGKKNSVFRQYKQALKLAVTWSQQLAIEQAILEFSIIYIKTYPQDRFSYDLAQLITTLLQSQDRFSDALFALNFLKNSKFNNLPSNKDIDLRIISLANKQGEANQILKITNSILANSSDPVVKARAFLVQADVYFSIKDKKNLLLLDNKISKLNKTVLEVREASAYVKLKLLKTVDQSNSFGAVQDITLKDPRQFLEKRYQEFFDLYSRYIKVCDVGSTSSCVDSMTIIQTLAWRFKESTEDIQISTSLSLPMQEKFNNYKNNIILRINQLIKKSKEMSKKAASYHGSTPQAVLDQLWISNKDWNFDPLSYGQGKGFLFWKMD